MRRDIIIYYLFCFFVGFYLANGTTVLFERVLGFSYSQVFILGAVYMLMFILFEVPSGAFADLVGRKKSVAIGCFVLTLGAVASGLSQNFLQLFLSFFLWALGFFFISGADEAMLYDRLQDEKLYTKTLSRGRLLFLVGTALAGVVGPMLFAIHFRYPYLFSSLPFLLGGMSVLFFNEASQPKRAFTIKEHLNQITTGFKQVRSNRYIVWSIGVMALTFAIWYNLTNSYQPFLMERGFVIRQFSFILPALFLGEALGGIFAPKLMQDVGEQRIFNLGLLLFGLSVGVAGILTGKISFAPLLFYAFLLGMLRLLVSIYSNRHIESSHRATIISVQGMVATVSAALTLFLFGFLTDRLGLSNLFMILGGLGLALGTMFLIFRPREPVVS
ncbi:MAG: MFS transporter [Candidatus Doudnabacteria bacterium]|nr:MFS transporter [Candidatus Doudnabacteria bacterium]